MPRQAPSVFKRLLRDTSCVAAIEFAIVAPVMITMFFGVVEMTNAIRVQAKVNMAAGQLAELVASQASVTIGQASDKTASLPDMCTGMAMNMAPFPAANMQASIGSVTVGYTLGFVHPATDWTTDVSCGPTSVHAGQTALFTVSNVPRSLFTQDGTPYSFSPGTPSGTAVMGYAAIAVIVTYTYTNIAPFFLNPTVTFTATASARPRSNTTVTCTTVISGSVAACPPNL